MKSQWSKEWRSSKQGRKQRKYLFNAPNHTKNEFMGCHLSRELMEKHGIRSAKIRSGDKVKVNRGKFKGHTGSVDRVDRENTSAYITGIELVKGDGSKVIPPIKISNMIITELKLDDKRRLRKSGKRKDKTGESGKEKTEQPK